LDGNKSRRKMKRKKVRTSTLPGTNLVTVNRSLLDQAVARS
jgi:hypothetical protein